jgi:HPt (histidine-containing phosphotransfer) domain-containing protein
MAKSEKKRNPASGPILDMPALDVSYLNNATFDDSQLRTEIVGLFRQQLAALLDQLNIPLDHASWAYLTHTLKGSASAVGALQLAGLAVQWDAAACPQTAAARSNYAKELGEAVASFNSVADKL